MWVAAVVNQKKAGKNLLRRQETSLVLAATTLGSVSHLSVLWLLCSMWLFKSRELRLKEPVLCRFSYSCYSHMVLLMQVRKAKRLSKVLHEQESRWNTPVVNVLIAETPGFASVGKTWLMDSHGCLPSFLLASQSREKNQLNSEHLQNRVYFLLSTHPNFSCFDLQDSCNCLRILVRFSRSLIYPWLLSSGQFHAFLWCTEALWEILLHWLRWEVQQTGLN